jgi:coenzyme F420-dependent glucose-6-phosphate dehydrogenase
MSKVYLFLPHEQFQPEEIVAQAELAERTGFDGVMVSEHFNPWVDDLGTSGFTFSTLGAIAQATSRIEIMTAVTTPLWRMHPAVAAQAAATVDRLSGGRFTLGVGTGYPLNEGPLGFEMGKYAEKAGRMEEALRIMKALLRGEKLDFSGQYYKTIGAKLYSPPAHEVPIILAAGGTKSATLAGRLADGVMTSVKQAETTKETVLEPARAAADDAGKPDPLVVCTHWTLFGKTDDEAYEAIKPQRGLRAPSKNTATDPAVLQKEADAMSQSELLANYTIVRSAQDYVRVYGEIAEAVRPDIIGIQTASVDQNAIISMLGEEVVPKLKKEGK